MKLILLVVFSYLLGAIPFSFLIAKARGVELHKSGTKNIGGSNVAITTGFKFGIAAMALDMLKGFAAVILARLVIGTDLSVVLCGLVSIVGHDFPVYLKFKGGKGLATTGGVFLAINPYIILACIIVYWALYLFILQYIMTTIVLLTLLPLLVWFFNLGLPYVVLAILSTLLTYWTHRKDIRKIITRTN